MELMPEGELLDVIGQIMSANYTERDVLIMFRQVVEAVDHCHRNNVVHCDIKVRDCLYIFRYNIKMYFPPLTLNHVWVLTPLILVYSWRICFAKLET